MLQVTTESVKPAERFQFWQEAVCNAFTRVDCSLVGDGAVLGRICATDVGAIKLYATESSALNYRRDATHLRKAPTDHFLVNYMIRGVGHVSQGGQTAVQRAGDLVVFDTARPYLLHYPEHVTKLTVQIPRPTLLSRVANMERLVARTFLGTSPLVALAGTVLREIARQRQIECSNAAGSMGVLAADVIAAAVQGGVPHPPSRHDDLLVRMKNYLIDNLGNPDIAVAQLAAAHFVSERTVNRLFAAEGTTAMRWLWRQRVATSYRALTESTARVTTVAVDCGFSSFSHFSRTFKKAYGIQPHLVARAAGRTVVRVDETPQAAIAENSN